MGISIIRTLQQENSKLEKIEENDKMIRVFTLDGEKYVQAV